MESQPGSKQVWSIQKCSKSLRELQNTFTLQRQLHQLQNAWQSSIPISDTVQIISSYDNSIIIICNDRKKDKSIRANQQIDDWTHHQKVNDATINKHSVISQELIQESTSDRENNCVSK